ncbi:MAG: HDOD domain-containing protein, partial [Thiovulaceae bacterium]|nr:HDOD domain-containing protein [Sulfurimonadaceae bacterium]
PLFPLMDIVKLDVSMVDRDELLENRKKFGNFDFTMLAEKVETQEQFEFFKSVGCELFQGYFFAKPDLVVKESLDPAYKSIFKLINLLSRDTDIEVISSEFEANPSITLQLLRFMNSGHLQLKAKIRSIVHAITLLGKEPLKHWLLLIAFAKSEDNSFGDAFSSPLMSLAQSRSKLMSELMKKISDDKSTYHEAALVGTLSLIDIITKTSMETVLGALEMDKSIESALLDYDGKLGKMLELALATEEFDIQKANALLKELKIPQKSLENALVQSYKI